MADDPNPHHPLHKELEALRNLVKEASVAIYLAQDSLILNPNPATLKMYGYSAEELCSKPFTTFLHPEDQALVLSNHIRRLKGEDIPSTYPYRIINAKGQVRYVEINAVASSWNGRPATLCIQTDITDRVKYEEALALSETRFRDLIEGSVEGIIIHRNFKPLFSNKSMASIFGYNNREEIMALETLRGLVAPKDYNRLAEYAAARLRGDSAPSEYEFEGVKKDGTHIHLEMKGRLISWDAEPALQISITDITERKKMDRMKSEFISTVSHELRTPLTSIRGALGLMNSDGPMPTPDMAKELLTVAYSNTNRLINLVNDILDVEKLESGSMEFDFQPLNLSELIEDAIKENAGFANEYGIEFAIATMDPCLIVNIDRNRITQAIANLLSNAAKFSPKGEQVKISVTQDKNTARVSVSDLGPGIAEEFKDHVFERFTQVDASDAREKSGTGLGLNITKSIIEKHNGTIDFTSHVGTGSTFFFTLPMATQNAESK